MKYNAIILLYINHLIEPLETIIKSPDFVTKYTLEEQQKINQLLLQQYRELEQIMKEEQ